MEAAAAGGIAHGAVFQGRQGKHASRPHGTLDGGRRSTAIHALEQADFEQLRETSAKLNLATITMSAVGCREDGVMASVGAASILAAFSFRNSVGFTHSKFFWMFLINQTTVDYITVSPLDLWSPPSRPAPSTLLSLLQRMEFIDSTMLQIEESPSADAFIEVMTEDEAAFAAAPLYRKSARYRKEHIDYARLKRIRPVSSIDDGLRGMLIALRDGAEIASLGTWTPAARGAAPAAAAGAPAASPAAPPVSAQSTARSRTLRLSREQQQHGKGAPLSSSRGTSKSSRSGGSFRKR
jgi:hypothetical protein